MKVYALSALAFLFAASAFAYPTRPVMVGGEPELDACGGTGIVVATTTLFKMDAQNKYIEFGTVNVNQMVASCDSEEDGEYIGVVFGEKNQDCKVSSPQAKRAPYKGPCKSGWVKKEFFVLIAG